MMAFKNNFVVAVKSQGNILREIEGNVYLPFNEHYSILLKNLSNKKVLVNIQIDGKHIGSSLIIDPNSESEIERYIGNLDEGRKFLFIEKNEEVKKFHGDSLDHGIIRVEYQFEKNDLIQWYTDFYYYQDNIKKYQNKYRGTGEPQLIQDNTVISSACYNTQTFNEGITVEGEKSFQKFHYGNVGNLEETKHVICLKLNGRGLEKKIETSITVKTKVTCRGCGKEVSPTVKFCSNCGTKVFI